MIDPDQIIIPRQPVESSNISSVGYDEGFEILEVEFKGGRVYRYYDVPKEEFTGLMKASSHGSYLNKHIKGGSEAGGGYRYEQK